MASRPTLLLLPGLLCDFAVWQAQLDDLGADWDCVVPDWGLRDSLDAMAEHALALVPQGPLAVAGHSMGGRVAFEMLRRSPRRVVRLALLDTSWHPLPDGDDGARERAGRLRLLEIARRDGMRAMGREWARGMVHPGRIDSPLFDEVLAMIERRTPEQFAAQIRALLARSDAGPLLADIRCPTLLLTGAQDTWSPPWRHEEMQRRIAGSALSILPGCGHMSPMEEPAAVSGALRAWLTGA